MRRWCRHHSPVLWALAFYAVCRAIDMASSVPNTPGFPEKNPFSRHTDGSFWLAHALITYLFYAVAMGLTSIALYLTIRKHNRMLAHFAASAVWIYFGTEALFTGAIPNILLALHLFVEVR